MVKPDLITLSSTGRCGIATYDAHERGGYRNTGAFDGIHNVAILKDDSDPDKSPTLASIIQGDISTWVRAAQTIKTHSPEKKKIVSMQIEHGLNSPGLEGYAVIATLLHDAGIGVVMTLHTVEEKPAENFRRDTNSTARNSDVIFTLNNRAREEILLRGVYGEIDPEKIVFFPHPIIKNDISDKTRTEIQKVWGVHGRRNMISLGLISEGKGLDIIADAIGEVNHKKLLPPETWEKFLYTSMGGPHPAYEAIQGGAEWRRYFDFVKRRLDEREVAWGEFDGMQEYIDADLRDINVAFVRHYLAEREFREGIAGMDFGIMGNQNYTQAVSGIGADIGTSRAWIATRSLFTEQQMKKAAQRRGPVIEAEERSPGYLVTQGRKGIPQMAEAIATLADNEALCKAMEGEAIIGREEQTFDHLAKRKVECFAKRGLMAV